MGRSAWTYRRCRQTRGGRVCSGSHGTRRSLQLHRGVVTDPHQVELPRHLRRSTPGLDHARCGPGVIGVIRTLRQRGTRCYLATNQEPYRAQHMSDTFGYKEVFDAEFYSCRLGVAKPDAAYFLAILNDLQVRPDRALFIDDRQENVHAARGVGLHAIEFSLDTGLGALNHILMTFGLPQA
ncbi:MAG: hypothetical protein DMF89_10900 [Acidobacteria bacterium]|nr:MAG: hypothetical protein DMF90_26315 [Acidobacteriota bacterium]PYR49903.1 MAG: hypothetical protein DMF89_10900 [Acidobacteriota bacterium]